MIYKSFKLFFVRIFERNIKRIALFIRELRVAALKIDKNPQIEYDIQFIMNQTYFIWRSLINRIIPVNDGIRRITDTNPIGPCTYLFNMESYISFQKSSIMIIKLILVSIFFSKPILNFSSFLPDLMTTKSPSY